MDNEYSDLTAVDHANRLADSQQGTTLQSETAALIKEETVVQDAINALGEIHVSDSETKDKLDSVRSDLTGSLGRIRAATANLKAAKPGLQGSRPGTTQTEPGSRAAKAFAKGE